ncbi:putative dehydrogenase [Paraburkholderia sp. GAS199]
MHTGFAVIGHLRLPLEEILLAFSQSLRARVALVSSSPEKAHVVARQYGVLPGAIDGYDDIGKLAANPAVQAVCV